MITLRPNSWGLLREYNPCHDPDTGRFCTPAGGAWAGAKPGRKKSRRAAAGEMRPATDKERKKLGIPPAYTDAMVAVDPRAELRATAKTAKGKTQYYHTDAYKQRQQDAKWNRILNLQADLPRILDRMGRKNAPPEALTLRLIMQTGLRNGGEDGDGEVDAFGASSLRMAHVTVIGDTLRLQFVGKGGVAQDHEVLDPILATYARQRQAAGAERLFDHDDAATLRYMKQVSEGRYKVHDLRTWYATVYADHLVTESLAAGFRPETEKQRKAFIVTVAKRVAGALGNTHTVALKRYIHPRVFDPVQL